MKKILVVILFSIILNPVITNAQVTQEWVATYGGTGTTSFYAVKNAIDKFGNLVVAGRTGSDFITLKYDNSGNLLWVRTYDGGFNNDDQIRDMVIDDSCNIYVTGYSYEGTTNGGVNWLTIKYNPDGEMIWKQSLDWTGHKGDDPNFIAVDANYNVYITGYGYVGPPPLLKEDLVIVKYNLSGEFQWANSYSNTTPQSSVGYSISINDTNYIYVSGYSGDSIIFIKFSSLGKMEWSQHYYCISTNLVVPLFSKTDHQSNVIINGYYQLAGQSNFVTLKYNDKGNLLWDRIFDSPLGTLDIANAINIDDSSNIFITGRTFTNFYNDLFVLKYSSNGDTLWLRTYDNGFSQDDEGKSITCDIFGNVYVTGDTQSPTTSNDFLTIKYDAKGELIWKKTYTIPSITSGQDFGISINLDRNSNVFVSGSCYFQTGRYGITSLKYSQITNIQNVNNSVIGYKMNNFPNPFNPATKIEYELPEDAFLSLKIFDSNGKLILTVLNEYKKSGIYSIDFVAKNLANGVYYCVMLANKQLVKSNKIILLK